MSHVLDVILCVSIMEDETSALSDMNSRIARIMDRPDLVALNAVDEASGGNKAMQCCLWAGAINHMDPAAMIRIFQGFPWRDPEGTTLVIQREQGDSFEVYRVPVRGPSPCGCDLVHGPRGVCAELQGDLGLCSCACHGPANPSEAARPLGYPDQIRFSLARALFDSLSGPARLRFMRESV